MPEGNVDIVRRAIEGFQAGFERGDLGAAWDTGCIAPDAEWLPAPEIPGPRSYKGRDGFVAFMGTWTEAFEDWSFRVDRLVEADDGRVVALVHQSATGRGSGVPVELSYGSVYEIEDGLVTRIRNYLDPAQALASVGLEP